MFVHASLFSRGIVGVRDPRNKSRRRVVIDARPYRRARLQPDDQQAVGVEKSSDPESAFTDIVQISPVTQLRGRRAPKCCERSQQRGSLQWGMAGARDGSKQRRSVFRYTRPRHRMMCGTLFPSGTFSSARHQTLKSRIIQLCMFRHEIRCLPSLEFRRAIS
jgi:hypothetical protein